MNVKEIKSEKLFKSFSISILYNEVDNLLNNKINELMPKVTLPGFRPGKAPFNIVKKKYENNYIAEIIEKISQEKTSNLIEQKKIKPFRQPQIEITKFEKNVSLEILIKIDIQPDFEIIKFSELKIEDYQIEIDSKTYDENYNNYILSQKTFKKISNNRPVNMGDKLSVSIKTDDQSMPDFLKSQENLPIITDSDYQILPDISSKLIENKLKEGDVKKIKFDMKEILKVKSKKLVEFEIEIKSIEEPSEVKIDKEFLQKNNFKSKEDFKNNINNSLKDSYSSYLKEIEKKQLMDLLESKHEFDIPEGIYKEEFKIIWERVSKAKENNQLDDDDKKISEDKLKKRYEKIALRRVKLAILMQKIAKDNDINVTEKELTDGMLNYASKYPGQEKEIFEYFRKNPNQIESIRGPIYEKKIIEFILSKVKRFKKPINIKEFNKLQEDTFSLKKEK